MSDALIGEEHELPATGEARTALSAISIARLTAPPSRAIGREPEICWLEVDTLHVDLDYQRRIDRHSERRIEKIAAAFDWTHFGAISVAPAGDFFAIIDGQHRATAAKLIGCKHVPCLIVAADRGAQARAFVAMNSSAVRVHPLQMHAAALFAGDPRAELIERTALSGGVKILRGPRSIDRRKANDTNSIGGIGAAIDRFGEAAVTRALKALSGHPKAFPGLVEREWILALCELGKSGFDLGRLAGVNLEAVGRKARERVSLDGGRRQLHLIGMLPKAAARAEEARK